MRLARLLVIAAIFLTTNSCYHAKPVKTLPNTGKVTVRTLFIALDGIDHTLMSELKKEGHFKDFNAPLPLVSTFPSSTTVGFTGLFQPLDVGKVPGYEVRFYSYEKNGIIGGTPKDIYKIPINYKYYFDVFRHTIQEKALMYSFPGIAAKRDLVDIHNIVFSSPKNILMTYIGSTDGSAHMQGRKRTKRFLIAFDRFMTRLQQEHQQRYGKPLRIVVYSDHGFEYTHLKTVSVSEMNRRLTEKGFTLTNHLESDKDIVAVRFGLISAGALFARTSHRAQIARLLSDVPGVDLTFWHLDKPNVIFIRDHKGQEARFEYVSRHLYRYVPINGGDPLHYVPTLKKHGFRAGVWLPDKTWSRLFFDHEYPEAGFRLYDSFFNLVENRAAILFSVFPNYQFGSLPARIGTFAKLGQRGTHGGLFKQTSWAFAMSNKVASGNRGSDRLPLYLRYDTFFEHYIPEVTKGYKQGHQ